jgi:hypothetical protein
MQAPNREIEMNRSALDHLAPRLLHLAALPAVITTPLLSGHTTSPSASTLVPPWRHLKGKQTTAGQFTATVKQTTAGQSTATVKQTTAGQSTATVKQLNSVVGLK